MQTKDHYYLALQLSKDLKNTFYRKAFVLGNILPDIFVLTYLSFDRKKKWNGHSFEAQVCFFQKMIETRSFQSSLYWLRVGVMMHYLADSFTRPHNDAFSFSTYEHQCYEDVLHCYFLKHGGGAFDQENMSFGKEKSFTWLEETHKTYLHQSCDVKDDFYYIISVCQIMYCFFEEKSYQEQLVSIDDLNLS